jgi:hypothetical protein
MRLGTEKSGHKTAFFQAAVIGDGRVAQPEMKTIACYVL